MVGKVCCLSATKIYFLQKVIKYPKRSETKEIPEKSVHLEVLHDPGPELRQADIIFVHGIKGALEKTWTQGLWSLGQFCVRKLSAGEIMDFSEWQSGEGTHSSEEEYSKCWPRDWLPMDCPHVRVIAVNYTTDPYLWRPFWMSKRLRTTMSERSWEMIHSLVDIEVGKHSIVWVGHSKGGLYVKQVLVHACETNEDKYKELSQNTKGVLFYSVPHRGSPLANLNLPPLFCQSVELTEVQKDCNNVLTLHQKFINLLDTEQLQIDVKSFIETQQTLMSFVYVQVVSEESADAQVGDVYGVPLDHRNICKPKNRKCFLYRELVSLIQAISENITTK
ncbi:hypothetical protein AAG570_003113 [Ranatra chinensis]|uniref:Protein SERAC1 n=1 Tax=Ranatra chinensis TaxID=642074 RepID=A0ABD0YI81_9HEMI